MSPNYVQQQQLLKPVLAIAILSVRPSVCPSHEWISQKWCKLWSPNLHHWLLGKLKFQDP